MFICESCYNSANNFDPSFSEYASTLEITNNDVTDLCEVCN